MKEKLNIKDIGKKIEKEVERIEEKMVKKKFSNEEKAMIGVIIVLAISLAVIFYPNIKNINIKPSINIIEITGCEDCLNITAAGDSFVKENVKIKSRKSLDYNSEEAKKLIEKYGIEKIPVLIITGDVDQLVTDGILDKNVFSIKGKIAIFDKPVPYLSLASGEINGLVSLKEIRGDCIECIGLSQIRERLEGFGVKIKEYEIIPASSEQGKNLVKENKLSFLPSLLISKNIEEYWWVFGQIKSSFIDNKDYYVFKTPIPPYKEISTGMTKGIVDITYIINNTCKTCFNVTQLKGTFQNLGVYIDKETYVDISNSDGESLLNQYKITAVPTIILSKEISDYKTITKVLEQVGTFEQGKFVFRKLDSLNVKYQEIGG